MAFNQGGGFCGAFKAAAASLFAVAFFALSAAAAVWTETQSTDWTDGLVSQTTWYPSTQIQLDWHGSTTGAAAPSAVSWMTGWDYRKTITINNGGASALSDYQVLVTSPVFNETGLVGSWHFEEGVGSTAADSSGNGYTGTTAGNFAWSSSGKFGNGGYFDGATNTLAARVDVPYQALPTTVGTIVMWVKRNGIQTTGTDPGLLMKQRSLNYSIGLAVEESGVDINKIRIVDNYGSATSFYSTQPLADGEWAYVALAWDASSTKLYVNGVLDNSAGGTFGFPSENYSEYIGAFYDEGDAAIRTAFKGSIDEVKIYSRALSDAEVKARYAKAKSNYDDLRFTKSDGTTLIPHWMENDGAFWVKVSGTDSIPVGNSTIYAYYGNSSAVSASSGPATFDFFDDFSGDLNKWTTPAGVWNIDAGRLKLVSGAGAYAVANMADGADYILYYKQYFSNGNNSFLGYTYWTSASSFYRYQYDDDYDGGTSGTLAALDRGATSLLANGVRVANRPMNAWRYFKHSTYASGGNVVINVQESDVVPSLSGTWQHSVTGFPYTDTSPLTNGKIAVGNGDGVTTYFDDVVVRKYAATEPVSSAGSEEGTYFSTGTYKSNVLDAGSADAIITQAAWNPSGQPGGAAVVAAARASNTLFAAGDATPAWTTVANGGNPGVYGRYLQYMSTFTTVELSTSPKLEDITLTYGWLTAPSGLSGTADSPSQITWNWTDNSSAPQEDGFKVYDALDSFKGSVGPGIVSWAESTGLSPNTLYTRYVQSYIGGVIANSGNTGRYTLPAAPTDGNIPCDKAISTPYNTPFFTFTNTAGFGPGGVQYFKYKWDADPSETTFPDTWSGGVLTLSIPSPGASYYLHIKSYNAEDAANTTTLTRGPYVSGIYYGAMDADETSGQFGGGLVKSSVTVSGTGAAAYVRLGSTDTFPVDSAYGWKYRREINISNAGTYGLTDYQVFIPTTSFGANWDTIRSSAQPTMADFRFTMSTSTASIPYWIESDTISPRGFWVKVSSIPTAGMKIHMYYGNSSAVSASSGAATFDGFDIAEVYCDNNTADAIRKTVTFVQGGQVVVNYKANRVNTYAGTTTRIKVNGVQAGSDWDPPSFGSYIAAPSITTTVIAGDVLTLRTADDADTGIYVKDLIVRKYAATEPSIGSVGGEELSSGYYPAAEFQSRVIDSGASGRHWGDMAWRHTSPSGTSIQMRARTGNTATPDGSWSSWSGWSSASTGTVLTVPDARYLQYASTFTTVYSTATPALDEVTVTYSWLNAPTGFSGTADSPTQITWNWTDNSAAPQNEDGFKIYDQGSSLKGTAGANAVSWVESPLSPNTLYTRYVQAYVPGITVNSSNASRYTLPVAPTDGNIPCDKSVSTPYNTPFFTFTNTAGFGSGGVQYFNYKWDTNPSETTFDDTWSGGDLTVSIPDPGVSYYLHIKSYNGDNAAGLTTLTKGPYVSGIYYGAMDADETFGQFGGGLEKSSVTISGTGNAAYVRLSTNSAGATFVVDGASGWNFRREINIGNAGTYGLTDYQVFIPTTSFGANWDAIRSSAQATMADFRFTMSTSTVSIPYWIEDNTTSPKGFWVKVSSIPTAGTKIHMYYGNSSAVSSNSGANTFEFFDDFDDGNFNGWTEQTVGYFSASNKYLEDTIGSGDIGHPTTYIDRTQTAWEWRAKQLSVGEMITRFWHIANDLAANGAFVMWQPPATTSAQLAGGPAINSGQYFNDGAWHTFRVTRSGATWTFAVDGVGYGSSVSDVTTASDWWVFQSNSGKQGYDDVRVRKYAGVDTSIGAVGGEELSGYFPSGEFQSRVMDSGASGRHWGDIGWRHTSPSGASIQMRARTGNTATPDVSWSSWYPLSGFYAASTGTALNVPDARYLQYASTFATSVTATPVLDEVTVTYSWLNAPTGFSGTADSPTQITWNWTDNSAAPQNEDGFKIYDQGSSLKGTAAQNAVSWVESPLSPNTLYTRYVQAYAPGFAANSGNASRYTLPVAPTDGNIPCDKSVSTPYNAAFFTFTNSSGFGAGGVQYFMYKWDTNPSETTFDDTWSGGDLTLNITSPGVSYYLHIKSYNGDNAAGLTTLTKGPYVSGIYYGATDADETSGQFGGGLVKSSVTVSGTGNAAYVRLSTNSAGSSFVVDGASGWNYRREINITNGGASGLSDYQVFIPTTSFGSSWDTIRSSAQATMADFRFTMSTATASMPYWIDSDTTSPRGFWVKVSSIPTSGATIYMYYGNPSAVAAGNGTSTFDFFDDFETGNLSKWSSPGAGTVSTAYSHLGRYSLYASNASNTSHVFAPGGGNYVVDFWMYDGGQAARSEVWFGLRGPASSPSFDLAARYDNTYFTYVKTPPAAYVNTPFTRNKNGWSKITVKYAGGGTFWYTVNDGSFYSVSTTDPGGVTTVGHGGGWGGQFEYADDFRVRKYAAVEPAISSVGAEELSGYYTSGEFQSRAIDAGATGRHWGHIGWKHVSPSGTAINIQVRTGNTSVPDGTWSSWSGWSGASTGTALAVPDARYLQYKSSFTTSSSAATPVLDDVAVTYGWLNAPTGFSGTADSPTQITWNWTDNSAAPQNEDGFKIYDQGSSLKGTAAQNAVSWVESPLSPNTLYTRYVQAYAPGFAANSGNASRYTLPATPTDGNIPCDKALSTPYNAPFFTFTNNSGFGAGGAQYFKYKWDTNPSETVFPDTWSGGELTLSIPDPGASYYLHIKSYNAADAANPATLTRGPYLSGAYYGAVDTDETSGQFGGGLVKSSVTVSGTGNSAYVRLISSGAAFPVDGSYGWNFRREINIGNAGTYGLTGYQVFIPTTSFGADWALIRSSAQATMADFRFTMATATASIPYWIESDTTAPRGFWVKVSSIPTSGAKIHMYYGNPSAAAANNGVNTFEAFDLTSYVEADPGAKYTVTSNKVNVTGETSSSSGLSTAISGVGDFRHDSEIYRTTMSGDGGMHILLADAITNPAWNSWGSNNGVGFTLMNNADSSYAMVEKYVAGTRTGAGQIYFDSGTLYYATLTRVSTTLTLSVYTDAARTTHRTGSPQTLAGVATTAFTKLLVAQNDTAYTGARTYYIQNPRLLKYASVEPSVGSIGGEERAGYFPSGEFQSRAIDAGATGRHWGHIGWKHVSPSGTAINMRVRTGNTATPDGSWSSWSGWSGASTGAALAVPDARYLQYASTFTTASSAATPVLDEVTVTYSWLNAPTGFSGTADSPTQITWSWTDASASPRNEDGFDVYDALSNLKGSVGVNAVSWVEAFGLSANTQYTRYVQAYATGITANSGTASRYTLAPTPTGANITCDKAAGTVYSTPFFTFTNAIGFGTGAAQYFKYKWDTNPAETTFPDTWSEETLSLSILAPGASYYLHIKSYNADDAGNPAALTKGPYLSGAYQGIGDTDETAGQFGGGLSTTLTSISGTGAAAYVRLSTGGPNFVVDGAGGWSFRREINISNSGDYGLASYQVFLPTSSFGADWELIRSSAQATMADFRFTMSTSTASIPYWIESDTTAPKGFWVKVSSIPTAGTKIHMYYGNSSAVSASNGQSAFDFFDDFNDGNYTNNPAWSVVNGVTWSASANYLQSTNDADGNIQVPSTITGASWKWRAKAPDYTSNFNDNEACFMYTDGGVTYCVVFGRGGPSNSDYSFQKNTSGMSGGWTKLIQGSGFDTNWHTYEVTRTSVGQFQLFFDGVSQGTVSDATSGSSVNFRIRHWGGTVATSLQVDDFRVRKYAAVEPAIGSVGAEELSGYSPSGEFQSRALDSGAKGTRWGDLAWAHSSPQGTGIKMRVRTGDTSVPDGTWSAWYPPSGWYTASTGTPITAPWAQYIQYMSSFTTVYSTASPQLAEADVWYEANTSSAPGLVSPADGIWLSSSRPVFQWNFADGETDSQTGFRVEIATHSSLLGSSPYGFGGTIAHDSGETASSAQSYQPASEIADGAYYWHVKTSDTYGAWSVYSSTWQIKLDTSAPTGHSISSVVPQITSCAVSFSVPADLFSGLNALPYSVRYSTSSLFEAQASTVTGWFAGASTAALSMQPGATYYFAVRARDAVLNESWSSPPYAKAMLADPPGLSASPYNVHASSVVVRWDPKNNAAYTRYRVQRSAKDDAGFSVTEDDSDWKTGISSWTFSTLELNSTYYFRVKAQNPAGLEAPAGTAWAALYSTQTLVNPPLANPPDVFVTSITAKWDVNNAPGTPFLVEISTTSDFSLIPSSSGWQNDISSYPFTGLVPNTAYFLRARARNSSNAETAGVSLYGEYTRAELPGGNVTPYTRTGSEITVNWNKNGNPDPDTEYFAVRSSTQDFSSDTDSSGWITNNSRQFTELAPGTTYYFRVKARNRNAVPLETDWKTLVSSVTSPAPATPTDLTLSYPDAVSPDRLTLNWSDNSSTELGFRIYESTDGAVYSLKDTVANNVETYLSVSLSTNTLYFYKAAAYNTNGESFTSAASTFTRVLQPAAQAFSEVLANSLKANWGGSGNPSWTAYVCEISTQSGFSPLLASSQTLLTNALFSDLTANVTYYARVKAVNGSGAATTYTDLGSTRTVPIVITVSASDMAPGGVTQGQSVSYAKIIVTPGGNNAAWSGLTVSRTGTGADQDVTRVSLRRDGNANGAFEAGNDPEAGWGVFASSAVTISLNETLNSAATYFVALLAADNYLSWPGNTLGVGIASTASFVSANSRFTMSPASFSSGLAAISKLADTLSVIPASVAPVPNVTRGQPNTSFLKLALAAARDRAYLTGLTVRKLGTLDDSYISFVKVYLDSDQSGQYNAGDALLSSGVDVFVSSQAAIQFVSPSTRAVINETYFIALDIAAAAPLGETVGVRAADSGAFGLMAGMPDSVNLTVIPGDSALPTVVDPPNTLIVTPASMGVTAVDQGETAALERVEFVTDSGNAVLSGFKVQRSSSSADGDYSMIALYRDNSPFGSFSAGSDSLVSSGTFSSGSFTFPIAETITYTSTKAYFVVAGISPSANAANKAGVLVQSGYITPAGGQTAVSAPVPFSSALAQINYSIDIITVTPDVSVAPGAVYQGASAVPLLKLGVKTDKNAAGLAGITLNQIGSAGDTDISSLRIYKDNGDGVFNAGQDAAVTGGYAFSGGTVAVSFSSIQNVTVSSGAYFIAADIAGAAVPGGTIQLRLADSSYFSVLAPDLVTSAFPIVSNVVSIEKFPATVLISTVSLAPASALAGAADIPMIKLAVRTDQSTAEMTSMSVMRQGGADPYVSGVKLFWDLNANGAADANELVSSGVFTGGLLNLPVAGTAKNLSAAARDYIVTMSLSSSAAIGASISAGFTGITIVSPDSVEAGRLPFASGGVQVAEPPSQLLAVFENKISSWVTQGDLTVLVASVTLRASAYSADWTRFDALRTGAGADSDIGALKIYADNGNGAWGGLAEENFIASGTFSSGQASLTFSPQNIAWPSAKTYYITADISNIASAGGAFGIELPAASYLGAQTPDTVGSGDFPFTTPQAAINATVDTLVVDWTNLSPSVKQGDTAKALGKLTLRSSANSVSLAEIKLDKTGTAADSDISGVQVYKDNGDGIFGAGDLLAGTAPGLTNGLVSVLLSPAREITTAAGDYFVTAGVSQLAVIGGTFGLIAGANGFKAVAPDLVSVTGSTVSFSIAGAIADSSDTVRVSFYDLASTSLYQGRSNNVMARLRFQTLQDEAVLTGIKIGLAGTAALADLGTVRIYADSNADGAFDPAADAMAGSGNFASSVLTITLDSAQQIATAPKDFFAVLDVAAGASIGNTVGFNFANEGYFTLAGVDGVETFSPAATVIAAIRDPRVPTPPAVNPVKADGTIALGAVAYNAYETRLRFQWNCNVYEGSLDQAYYSIGPSPAASTSVWTSIGVRSDVTITGLNLTHAATYYVSVRVKNSLGEYLSDIVSRKFIVDTFKPVIPSGISAREEGDASVVSWPEASVGPSGLVYYQVEERRGNSPEWTVISTTTEKTLIITRSGIGVSALEKPAGSYGYRVRAVNGAGVPGDASQPVTVNLGLDSLAALTDASVYPNPFDSRKTRAAIAFTLNSAVGIKIVIYDVFGGKVRDIKADGVAGANIVYWDGTAASGSKVSRGVYLCVIKAAGSTKVLKVAVKH